MRNIPHPDQSRRHICGIFLIPTNVIAGRRLRSLSGQLYRGVLADRAGNPRGRTRARWTYAPLSSLPYSIPPPISVLISANGNKVGAAEWMEGGDPGGFIWAVEFDGAPGEAIRVPSGTGFLPHYPKAKAYSTNHYAAASQVGNPSSRVGNPLYGVGNPSSRVCTASQVGSPSSRVCTGFLPHYPKVKAYSTNHYAAASQVGNPRSRVWWGTLALGIARGATLQISTIGAGLLKKITRPFGYLLTFMR
eukprot:1175518-Prorocentrum_minimum.AAC.1